MRRSLRSYIIPFSNLSSRESIYFELELILIGTVIGFFFFLIRRYKRSNGNWYYKRLIEISLTFYNSQDAIFEVNFHAFILFYGLLPPCDPWKAYTCSRYVTKQVLECNLKLKLRVGSKALFLEKMFQQEMASLKFVFP